MRPYTLTHRTTRPDKHQGTTTQNQEYNSILILDARIHYPVLKHPTKTPHPPPGTKPPPHPHPRNQPGRKDDKDKAVCPRARTRDPKKQPTPHPTPPQREQGQRGAGSVPSGPNSAPPPTPDRAAPARTGDRTAHGRGRVYDVSTHEHTPRPARAAPGACPPHQRPTTGRAGEGSSLERR